MIAHTPHILVPLDMSPLAEAVLPVAVTIAQATHRGLTLVTVAAPAESLIYVGDPARIPLDAAQRWELDEVAQARDYLAGLQHDLEADHLPVHTDVIVSPEVAAALIAYVVDHPQIKMIAMTTHGYSGFRHWVMGSIAEAVLHATNVPLLLLRAEASGERTAPAAPLHTILVPLDGSSLAERALDLAQPLAAATGATLVLMAVVPVVDDRGLAEGGVEPMWELAESADADARLEDTVEQAARKLREAGIAVQTTYAHGEPAGAILRTAADVHADLIVMATHDRHGLSRMLHGSVAHDLVRRARQPVLLIKDQSPAARA